MIVPQNLTNVADVIRFFTELVGKLKKPSSITELQPSATNEEIISKINDIIKALKLF